MRPNLLTSLPLLALLLFSGAVQAQDTALAPPAAAQRSRPLVFSGKIYNSSSIPVLSPFAGTVVRTFHVPGDTIKKDAPLLEIKLERQQLIEIKRKLDINLVVKKSELDIDKAELELKNLNEKKKVLEILVHDNMATARDLQLTIDQIAIAEKSLAAIRNSLSQTRSDQADLVKLYTEQFGQPVHPGNIPPNAILRSPVDGVVLQAAPGTDPGMRVSGQLFVVGCMNPMLIRAQAFESDAAQLHVGDEATAEVEALGGKRLQTKLTSISWTPTNNQLESPSYYLLELTVENPDNSLREGYKVRITF